MAPVCPDVPCQPSGLPATCFPDCASSDATSQRALTLSERAATVYFTGLQFQFLYFLYSIYLLVNKFIYVRRLYLYKNYAIHLLYKKKTLPNHTKIGLIQTTRCDYIHVTNERFFCAINLLNYQNIFYIQFSVQSIETC